MANIVVDILNDESPEVSKELSISRLVGIPKPEKSGVRPIGIGEPLLKIAAATALKKCGSEIDEHFGDKQFVLRDGGAEEIIHTIRKALREGKVVSALDSANAFNTIERSAIAQALLDLPAASPLYGVFNSMYNRTSRLRVFTESGFTDVLSQRGVRQGDPLGSVLYALGTFSVLTAAAARHPDCKIIALRTTFSSSPRTPPAHSDTERQSHKNFSCEAFRLTETKPRRSVATAAVMLMALLFLAPGAVDLVPRNLS